MIFSLIEVNSYKPVWRYRCLIRLLSPLVLAYTLWRTGKDGGRRYFMQRLSLDAKPPLSSQKQSALLWIHAASVGEIYTVLPLLQKLDQPLLVTTTTPTGAAVLRQLSLSHVQHQYLPVDFPGACRRFFESVNIREGWIVETEIWPWLYARAKSYAIPLSIINARLSDRTSSQANGFLASALSQALTGVRILARSKNDAERFVALGATPTSISIVGNLKYANPSAGENHDKPQRLIKRPYLLAASTHEDEELQLSAEWCKHHHDKVPDVVLVIVPRHPERGIGIQKQLKASGINAALRSHNEPLDGRDSVYIADTIGELQAWYAHAIAGFIGGSLVKRGGHNMLEAARQGCPIVTGPHTYNFDDIVQSFRQHDALTVADTVQQIMAFFNQALDNPQAHAAMSARARTQAEISESVLNDYLKRLLPA